MMGIHGAYVSQNKGCTYCSLLFQIVPPDTINLDSTVQVFKIKGLRLHALYGLTGTRQWYVKNALVLNTPIGSLLVKTLRLGASKNCI